MPLASKTYAADGTSGPGSGSSFMSASQPHAPPWCACDPGDLHAVRPDHVGPWLWLLRCRDRLHLRLRTAL